MLQSNECQRRMASRGPLALRESYGRGLQATRVFDDSCCLKSNFEEKQGTSFKQANRYKLNFAPSTARDTQTNYLKYDCQKESTHVRACYFCA
jgi:hypothetical protein